MHPNKSELGTLKAEMARQDLRHWKVAVQVGVHPVIFSGMLSGRIKMPARVYEDTCGVLQIMRTPPPSEAA